jgi:FMN phosphatase YigB (HAD superfamily)
LLFFNSLHGSFCRSPGKKCRSRRSDKLEQGLRRSLDIAGHSFGTNYRSKENTAATRYLTPVDTTHAEKHADDQVASTEKHPRHNFARGNFFRIIDAKVSHFFDLSVALMCLRSARKKFFSNVRLISRSRTLITQELWGFSGMTIATADASRRTQCVSAFSFDVFDTFLVRACTTPDGVFERAYDLSGISEKCPNVSESFVQHRIQAEARARKVAKKQSGSAEVRIADIYSYFPFRLFGISRDRRNDLAEAEFRAELELCRANPEMLRHYLDMKSAGHRVGFISDTYWSSEQLGRLLRACAPGLTWDFLYASCDHGSSKSEELFAKYLSEQRIDAAASFHVGDNDKADVKGARRHGIRPRYFPQATAQFASKLQREGAIFELLCPGRPSRLDHGFRTLRRMVASQSAEKSQAFHLGVEVLGPVMAAFDVFIEARRARLARAGRRVAVGFLGRDGFLSHRIWRDMHGDAGAYIEINRRVSLVGSADTLEPLAELLGKITKIDAPTFADIIKVLPPKVARFFATYPDGIATGRELADALPDLMNADEVADISAGIRKRLLAYLRLLIPGFDSCTDLVLADLGYSASVQKAMRRIFDLEGLGIRLHGAYLLTLDDAFDDIADGDTAEGLISDLVVTPHVKRVMIRNVAVLEQICCSGDGSVRDYRGAEVLREINPRPAEQIALASEIQSGAIAYVTRARELGPRYNLQPFAALDVAARWATASLARLLLLPDDDELVLLGELKHDVNLGTHALAPMIDGDFVTDQMIARGIFGACASLAPPMWLAGSFAMLSPAHSYLYVLFGANRLPSDVFGETASGTIQVGLFRANGQASMETVTVFRTGSGELRLRIPIARAMAVSTIAVQLARFARQGIIDGVVIQTGESVADAAANPELMRVADSRLVYAGIERTGRHYHAPDDDGCLLIQTDRFDDEIAVYTIALRSLSHDRILAAENGGAGSAGKP